MYVFVIQQINCILYRNHLIINNNIITDKEQLMKNSCMLIVNRSNWLDHPDMFLNALFTRPSPITKHYYIPYKKGLLNFF